MLSGATGTMASAAARLHEVVIAGRRAFFDGERSVTAPGPPGATVSAEETGCEADMGGRC